MQRTCWWRAKSILSFHSATGLCAATARWATRLSKIHTRLAGSKASGPCVFQRKRWGKRFFVAAPMHLTMCISQAVCLCSIPTLSQYPPTPISVVFISQNGTQPICLAVVESSTSARLDVVLTCTEHFVTLSPHITNTCSSDKQRRAEGLKGRRHRNESEKSISARTAVNWACASVMGGW